MLALGQDEIAKYPFLADAGDYLKDKGFSIYNFGIDPVLKISVDKAYHRITASTEGKIYDSDLIDGQASKPYILEREVFSFLVAIVLIKLSRMPTLVKRFALAEARRAESYLKKDLGRASNPSEIDLLKKIIFELSGIEVMKKDDFFTISVPDYLKQSATFNEKEWKLINRHVENGKVFLNSEKIVRLLRKEISVYISSKINKSPTPEMIPGLETKVNDLISLAKKYTPVFVSTGEYPPCIKHAINILEKGENLAHSGRFMLATFLLAKGQSVQQIAPLFKNAPDYNERVTLYQLNNLAGTSGSGTQYFCPSCQKLQAQSLCFATSECDNIINPMQFGRKKK
ncbi:MAG: DNA primase [Nitrosopumilus sp.]|nr:MAG: DNA primase [Nitrosopumilus sp.]